MAYLQQRGIEDVRRHEQQLLQQLLDGVREMPGVTLHGPADPARQSGVVSLTVAGYDPQEVAALLDSAYSVQVRSGLHCAPRMHSALGTAAGGGTVRFSVGPFNSVEHIDRVIGALEEMASANPTS